MPSRLDTEARKLVDRRKANDTAQAEAKRTKKALVEQETAFYDLLEAENLPTATLDLGPEYGRMQFGRRSTIYSRVIDAETAIEALKAAGRGEEMIKNDLRKAPLNEMVRDLLENGQPLPAGIDYSETKYVQVTRRKK